MLLKLFIGLGFPYEGPAPLEAIAHGCVFINPKFTPPHNSLNTKFFVGKPTLRQVIVSRLWDVIHTTFRRDPDVYTGPSRGKERGKSFPGPSDVWAAPPSLRDTENGFPDGFFLTSNMHKIYFRPGRPGLRPGPRWESLRRSPRSHSRMVRGHSSPRFLPLESRRLRHLDLGAWG